MLFAFVLKGIEFLWKTCLRENKNTDNKKNQNLWDALIEFHKYLHFHVSDLNNKIE